MFEVASSPVEPQTAMSPAPMSTWEAGGGAGAETVIDEVPDLPPADALIVATPAATPVTIPDETVATALFDELHMMVVADPGGFAVAVSRTVVPAATVALEGDTEIDFTLLGEPPLANDGASVSLAGGADVSEHAARATLAAMAAAPAYTMVRLCMTSRLRIRSTDLRPVESPTQVQDRHATDRVLTC